jgi:hypothetical protein
VNQSNEINLIAKALVAVQSELVPVIKDSTNPHFKNDYASLEAITEYVRPLLAKNGLAVLQGGGEMTNGGLSISTTLVHESGQWISSSLEMPLEKATPQSAGSAITYGRRYGLAAFLALTTEEDDDGEAASWNAKSSGAERRAAPDATGVERENTTPASSAPRTEESCPKCSGRMWDNRKDKKNPRAPDFKCRDAKCAGVIWPPKEKKAERETVTAGGPDEFPAALRDEPDDLPF